MNEYTVTMCGTVFGSITVEAENKTAALLIATEQGMELADIHELHDWSAVSAEFFQKAAV